MTWHEQRRLSLILLGTVCATCVLIATLAHVTRVIADHLQRERALQQVTNGTFFDDGGYIDDGDYVLLGRIPNDDYSRGGVIFLGDSEMVASLQPRLLPEAEQKLIRNYSLGDLRHREVRYFLRTLVDEHGLLKAGADKTTVILGLSWLMAAKKDLSLPLQRYVKLLFERHGEYTYDWETGIRRTSPSPLVRFLRIERDFANRYLRDFVLAPSRVRTTVPTDEWKLSHLMAVAGPDWQEDMKAEVAELAKLLDELQALGVRVRAILPPTGSWSEKVPYEAAYQAMIRPLLAARNIPLDDFSNFLPDSEFGDDVHARHSGQLKLHEAYRGIALKALEGMGTSVTTP